MNKAIVSDDGSITLSTPQREVIFEHGVIKRVFQPTDAQRCLNVCSIVETIGGNIYECYASVDAVNGAIKLSNGGVLDG